MGTWKYVCSAFSAAAFPALCSDYLARVAPAVPHGGARVATIVTFNVALSLLNYTGLSVVGWSAVALGLASLSPFVVMSGAQDPAAPVGGDGQRKGLEALPQYAVLEPQLLAQRQHHGRRGGPAREDVPRGAAVGRVHGVARVPAAAHGGHRCYRLAAGGLGERLLRRRCRSDRRQVAQVLDRGWRRAVLHRPLLGVDEQRGVPPRRHGGPRPPAAHIRVARPRLRHAVGQHRLHGRHRPGHVLLQLHQHRRSWRLSWPSPGGKCTSTARRSPWLELRCTTSWRSARPGDASGRLAVQMWKGAAKVLMDSDGGKEHLAAVADASS